MKLGLVGKDQTMASTGFKHFPELKVQFYKCLSVDAKITVSNKCLIIGGQVIVFLEIIDYHSNSIKRRNTRNFSF